MDFVHSKKPDVLFLMETMVNKNKLQPIKIRLGFSGMFVVDSLGLSNDLALLWNNDGSEVDIISYSKNHIDAIVRIVDGEAKWRFTGFYGVPDRRRRES